MEKRIKYPKYTFEQDGRRVLSKEQIASIISLRKEGISLRKIGRIIGCSKTIVSYYTNLKYTTYHNISSIEYVKKRRIENKEEINTIDNKRRIKKRRIQPEVLDYFKEKQRVYSNWQGRENKTKRKNKSINNI